MRRILRLFLQLTVIAASLVTAMVAAPPSFGIHGPMTISDATAMMQNTAVIASLLAIWMFAAVSLTMPPRSPPP